MTGLLRSIISWQHDCENYLRQAKFSQKLANKVIWDMKQHFQPYWGAKIDNTFSNLLITVYEIRIFDRHIKLYSKYWLTNQMILQMFYLNISPVCSKNSHRVLSAINVHSIRWSQQKSGIVSTGGKTKIKLLSG